jgi:hypothetical protein
VGASIGMKFVGLLLLLGIISNVKNLVVIIYQMQGSRNVMQF